jgi:hypothetical protein
MHSITFYIEKLFLWSKNLVSRIGLKERLIIIIQNQQLEYFMLILIMIFFYKKVKQQHGPINCRGKS